MLSIELLSCSLSNSGFCIGGSQILTYGSMLIHIYPGSNLAEFECAEKYRLLMGFTLIPMYCEPVYFTSS